MKKHHFLGIILVLVVAIALYSLYETRPVNLAQQDIAGRASESSPTVTIGDVSFSVVLARTESERARGLMYVKKLGDDQGMLFVFEKEESQIFWNNNTKLPLKVIWILEEKVIGISELPSDEIDIRLVNSPGVVSHVLEVASDSELASHIKIGDSVLINE